VERQSLDEQRHGRASRRIALSTVGVDAEDDLGLQRLDAEYNELLAGQPLLETAPLELVSLRREAQTLLSPVGDPLSRALLPELWQLSLEGPQGLLPQLRLLLFRHDLLSSQADRHRSHGCRHSHPTRELFPKAH
jgi:hypothetical protein